MIEQRLKYLNEKPVKTDFVKTAEEYKYSNAKDYAGVNCNIDIELLD